MDLLGVGIDLGTGYMGFVTQHLTGNMTSKTAPITTVFLDNKEVREKPDIKQIALYLDNGSLVYGKDVRKAIKANPDLQDSVIELSKLALHPEFRHVPEVIHTRNILSAEKNRGAMQDFFADLLRCIVRDVRNFQKEEVKEVNGSDSTSYWENMSTLSQTEDRM